jgi:hypothetical protein
LGIHKAKRRGEAINRRILGLIGKRSAENKAKCTFI